MNLLTKDFRASLLSAHESPCLSLYQPTHRHHPGNQEDPIRFRNLVKELEQSLQKKYPTEEIRSLLEPFEALSNNHDFWNHTTDGLAVFGALGFFQVFGLQRTTPEHQGHFRKHSQNPFLLEERGWKVCSPSP